MKIIDLEGQYCNRNYIGCSASSLATAGFFCERNFSYRLKFRAKKKEGNWPFCLPRPRSHFLCKFSVNGRLNGSLRWGVHPLDENNLIYCYISPRFHVTSHFSHLVFIRIHYFFSQ